MDNNQKLEEARRQAATLQEQLQSLRARGGDPAAEARIEQELFEVYKVLGNPAAAPAIGQPAPAQAYGQQPMGPGYAQNVYGQPAHRSYEASRGTMILVFGILSLVVCQLFGPFAWSMGNEDLRKVDAGLMDPRDRGSIQAGRICGMIGTGLLIASLVLIVGMILTAAGAASQY